MANAKPIVQMRGIRKHFGKLIALQDVSLAVAQGEVLAIIGPSGCGKSTLLRCIIGLETPDRGDILIDGEALFSDSGASPSQTASRVAFRRLRNKMGMVFQSYSLFPHMTVLQNVMVGPINVRRMSRSAAQELASQLLAKVGLSDKIHEYPAKLSGGQKQRASIARAMAMEPEILLCDEITSSLDPELIAEVLVVLKELAKDGMTMVVVTHELSFAGEVADRLIFMDGGLLVEEGHPKVVLRSPKHERTSQFLQKVLQL